MIYKDNINKSNYVSLWLNNTKVGYIIESDSEYVSIMSYFNRRNYIISYNKELDRVEFKSK